MGLTRPRASQIFDIDYKQATRTVAVADITLTGSAPAMVDGVTLVTNDRILVTGQTDASENGIYTVTVAGVGSDGTWIRATDSNEDGEIQAGMVVMVTEGVVNHDTQWKLTTDNPIDIGVSALVFVPNISSSYNNANVATYLASGTVSTNIQTTADISASGNITSAYILGDGSQLTGLPAGYANADVATYLASGTVSTNIQTTADISASGNITAGNIATSGSVGSHLVPSIDLEYSLGNATHRWANLYLSGNTIYLGNSIITESANGDIVIENSGSFAVPVGTTSQRSEIQGAIRYNTTIGGFETYDGAGWNKLAYGTATDFPFGNYGSLIDIITSDAFGVSLVSTFDCAAEGPLQITDLGHDEAFAGV